MFLQKIIKQKKVDIATAKRRLSFQELERQLVKEPAVFAFHQSLSKPGLALIAEIKKASPSKGLLCPDFDPRALAQIYAQNGAAAISVLTEEHFFQGSLDDLKIVKDSVSLPVLRKDFVIDAYQIMEAAVARADAVLLIAAIVDLSQLKEYLSLARELGLNCLTEVHNYQELELALNADAPIIGVNNRNLETFTVSLSTSLELAKEIPPAKLKVSESGIFTRADVLQLQQAGFNATLVGEAIVKAADRAAKIKELALIG